MIAEVRGLVTLAGFRGRPKGDLAAFAQAIVALSRLADDASVLEAEINPLIVGAAGDGVVAVDALVRLGHDPEKWEPVFGKGHAPPNK
jgi:succinyl-CoA synthetase beta subunit